MVACLDRPLEEVVRWATIAHLVGWTPRELLVQRKILAISISNSPDIPTFKAWSSLRERQKTRWNIIYDAAAHSANFEPSINQLRVSPNGPRRAAAKPVTISF
jgi:hypothetical protein